MIKVGITGAMGSGKTMVCRIFGTLHVPVYNADERARWLMEHDEELKAHLRESFGAGIYAQGKLLRKKLAAIVFDNAGRLKELNALVHPRVREDALEWMNKRKDYPYVIREAALLFESGSHRDLDLVITVTAPLELRLDRIAARDGSSREEALKRMARQWPEEEKVRRSQYVIVNDGTQLLVPQVMQIHGKILALSRDEKNDHDL